MNSNKKCRAAANAAVFLWEIRKNFVNLGTGGAVNPDHFGNDPHLWGEVSVL